MISGTALMPVPISGNAAGAGLLVHDAEGFVPRRHREQIRPPPQIQPPIGVRRDAPDDLYAGGNLLGAKRPVRHHVEIGAAGEAAFTPRFEQIRTAFSREIAAHEEHTGPIVIGLRARRALGDPVFAERIDVYGERHNADFRCAVRIHARRDPVRPTRTWPRLPPPHEKRVRRERYSPDKWLDSGATTLRGSRGVGCSRARRWQASASSERGWRTPSPACGSAARRRFRARSAAAIRRAASRPTFSSSRHLRRSRLAAGPVRGVNRTLNNRRISRSPTVRSQLRLTCRASSPGTSAVIWLMRPANAPCPSMPEFTNSPRVTVGPRGSGRLPSDDQQVVR